MTRALAARARIGLFVAFLVLGFGIVPGGAQAGPYAAMVMDARTGEVLHAVNADTRLHPASLTKMMTLYVAFDAIRRGEITLDTMVTVSQKAANEPPSRLGLRPGQRIALRYLIRAAAVRSANDAATAIGEAISGSERAFAQRMTRTARALGMNNSTFHNAHGLTQDGHLSTARDMTILGRRLIYDFPQYYNIFGRRSADAGVAEVVNTNSRFLESYSGADGIKTGFTRAAGFNLVASAERGGRRIIATVFGGTSTAQRNARVAELLDLGFREAPARVAQRPLPPPNWDAEEPRRAAAAAAPAPARAAAAPAQGAPAAAERPAAGRTIRLVAAPSTSIRPMPRPDRGAAPPPAAAEPPPALMASLREGIESALAEVAGAGTGPAAAAAPAVAASVPPPPRPDAPAAAPAPSAEVPFAVLAEAPADAVPAPAASAAAPAAGPAEVPVQMAAAATLRPRPSPRAAAAMPAPVPAEPPPPAAEPAMAAAAQVPGGAPSAAAPDPAEPLPFALVQDVPEAVPAAPTEVIMLAAAAPAASAPPPETEVVTRLSSSGGRHWGVTLGRFASRGEAERVLLRVALAEAAALDGALRRVTPRPGGGYEALMVGLSRDQADLACRRLQARGQTCLAVGP